MGFSPADKTHVMIVATNARVTGYQKLMWRCAGCGDVHAVHAKDRGEPIAGEPSWAWDGSMTAPTFSPSIRKDGGEGGLCHSFVRAGVVQFLPDCQHALAGQSVAMKPEDADPFAEHGEVRKRLPSPSRR